MVWIAPCDVLCMVGIVARRKVRLRQSRIRHPIHQRNPSRAGFRSTCAGQILEELKGHCPGEGEAAIGHRG
jgi:hypothetical protein